VARTFPSDVRLICEPGRYLSEPSMALVSSVIADRVLGRQRIVYLDVSAYNGLFETTFITPGGEDLNILTERLGQPSLTQVVGPIMDSFDVIKRDALLPDMQPRDLVIIPNTGAYSWGYGSTCEGRQQLDTVVIPEALDSLLSQMWFD